jgi:hypothetical protein
MQCYLLKTLNSKRGKSQERLLVKRTLCADFELVLGSGSICSHFAPLACPVVLVFLRDRTACQCMEKVDVSCCHFDYFISLSATAIPFLQSLTSLLGTLTSLLDRSTGHGNRTWC